jgi:hypothetical protein
MRVRYQAASSNLPRWQAPVAPRVAGAGITPADVHRRAARGKTASRGHGTNGVPSLVRPGPGTAVSRGALAVSVMLAAGCATLEPQVSKAWKVEPVLDVRHTIQSAQGYFTLGRYYDGMRMWDKSIEAYRKAIAADGGHIEARNGLGVALAQRWRHDDAEAAFREAIALAPNAAHVRSNLGYVLMLAGKPLEAVRELRAAVALDKTDATAIANLREAVWQLEVARTTDPAVDRRMADLGPVEVPPAPVAAATTAQPAQPTLAAPAAAAVISVAAPLTQAEVAAPLVAAPLVTAPVAPREAPAPQPATPRRELPVLSDVVPTPSQPAAPPTPATPPAHAAPKATAVAEVKPAAAPAAVAAPVAPAAAVVAAAATPVQPAPAAMQVVDRPTVASLQAPRAQAASAEARLQQVVVAQAPAAAAPAATRVPGLQTREPAPTPVAVRATLPGPRVSAASVPLTARLEVSNGNGVPGIASRLRSWLGNQGVVTTRLTNQPAFAQRETVVHFRRGHEESARRVAETLPAPVTTLERDNLNLRVDVRVVLGRDWMQSAACIDKGTCRVPSTAIAQAEPKR